MATTLAQLADLVGGELNGDGWIAITGAGTLDDVQSGEITLIDRPERLRDLAKTAAAAAVVPLGVQIEDLPTIAVDDVHAAFTAIVLHFRPPRRVASPGVSPYAMVSETAKIGPGATIHAQATIGEDVEIAEGTTVHSGAHIMAGSKIGRDATIMPGAVLYERSVVGDRVIIHSGAVIGAYGFGYTFVDGRHQLSAQLGHVEIGNDVEIGAATTIDCGTYGPTIIGEGTKIDNQVMIAHNCRIGRHNMICSQVGIAGSTSTGDYVVMAGQVGVRDHVHIGDRVVLGAKSGVSNDVASGEVMIGIPATPQREQKLKQAALAKLPEMRKEFKALRRTVEELRKRLGDDRAAA